MLCVFLPRGDHAGPGAEERDARGAVVGGQLDDELVPGNAFAVVAGEDNESVLMKAAFLERIHDSADAAIDLFGEAVVRIEIGSPLRFIPVGCVLLFHTVLLGIRQSARNSDSSELMAKLSGRGGSKCMLTGWTGSSRTHQQMSCGLWSETASSQGRSCFRLRKATA